jgi:multiple antibiotic resistance protein
MDGTLSLPRIISNALKNKTVPAPILKALSVIPNKENRYFPNNRKIRHETLTAMKNLNSRGKDKVPESDGMENDYSIVPLAIPITVGPGIIGVLMVLGAENNSARGVIIAIAALLCAVISVVLMLLLDSKIHKIIGKKGMEILPKITGLLVSAIGAQIIFTGIKGFLF